MLRHMPPWSPARHAGERDTAFSAASRLSVMPISPYLKGLRDELGTRLLLMPGVTAVVFDDIGRVLLTERSDNGHWALVAGVMDPGEQLAETAVRECYEETAVRI